MDPDSFFSNLPDDIDDKYEAIKTQRQLSFEESVIKKAFTLGGVKVRSWGMLVNQCRQETGMPKLNFNWFNSNYRFPVRLCGKCIPKIYDLTIMDLFKPADKNRLFKAILKALYKQEVDTRAGFAFAFPVVRTLMCAHNVLGLESSGPRWTMTREDGILLVEPAQSFFQSIGSEWAE